MRTILLVITGPIWVGLIRILAAVVVATIGVGGLKLAGVVDWSWGVIVAPLVVVASVSVVLVSVFLTILNQCDDRGPY